MEETFHKKCSILFFQEALLNLKTTFNKTLFGLVTLI